MVGALLGLIVGAAIAIAGFCVGLWYSRDLND